VRRVPQENRQIGHPPAIRIVVVVDFAVSAAAATVTSATKAETFPAAWTRIGPFDPLLQTSRVEPCTATDRRKTSSSGGAAAARVAAAGVVAVVVVVTQQRASASTILDDFLLLA